MRNSGEREFVPKLPLIPRFRSQIPDLVSHSRKGGIAVQRGLSPYGSADETIAWGTPLRLRPPSIGQD